MACLVASPLSTKLNKMAHAKKKAMIIEIPNEKSKKNAANLQEAFEKFRKGRKREIRMAKVMEERALSLRQDQVKMDILRAKFLDGVKKYFGVPYAKRYHDENSLYHNAPLFLDCCGLVRRVLLDLKEDFGFKVGGGNQAHQFDTLPMDIKEEDMKAGDLVFISATYYEKPGKKWKKQRHDMVHVEVWAGDGEKTIGARWQKGVVQVFDSYKFVSKSYYNMKYHFKSIDTWLMGICKSFCPEHPWRSSKYDPGRKSIFSEKEEEDDEDQSQAAEEEEEEIVQQQRNGKSKKNGTENVCEKHEISNAEKVDDGKTEEQDENVKENMVEKKETCEVLIKSSGVVSQERLQNSSEVISKVEKNEANCKDDRLELEHEKNGEKSEGNRMKSGQIYEGNTEIVAQHTKESEGVEIFSDNEVAHFFQIAEENELETNNKKTIIPNDESEEVENIAKISEETVKTIIENVQNRQKILGIEAQALQSEKDVLKTVNIDGNKLVQTEDENQHFQIEFIEENELVLTNCSCPECLPSFQSCVHNTANEGYYENASELDEGGFARARDITTSLECFEVIGSPESRQEVEESFSSCPTGKSGQSSSSSGNSPENDEKPSRGSNGSPPKKNNNKKNKDNSNRPGRNGTQSRMRDLGRQPTFYVSPGNGSSMVAATLESLGWRKIEDRHDESFKLKWVECKSQIDYKNFREGDQLVNHISNIGLLTTKLGLLCSLEEYERVLDKVGSKQRIQLSEFVPETIKLTNLTEKQKFVNEVYKEGDVWICKPIGQNQGKGIYMINSSAQLRDRLRLNGVPNEATNERRNSRVRPPQDRIIQRYITNPLLLNGFKFDVRAYMFIASTNPYIVLYHPGYIRLSCVPYSPFSEEASSSILTAHLTNQYIQKKHPLYSSMKDETVWSYERLQSYIDEHHSKEKGLAENWMFGAFTKRMHQIMLTCFHSVRKKLHRRSGFFDLLGFDFMIDENFKVWLIEVNVNPSLSTNCQVLKEVIPDMVDSTVKIALEIFDKTKKRRPVFPLENINGFTVLYNGEGKS